MKRIRDTQQRVNDGKRDIHIDSNSWRHMHRLCMGMVNGQSRRPNSPNNAGLFGTLHCDYPSGYRDTSANRFADNDALLKHHRACPISPS
jgi:hypothetical protein